MISFCGEVAHIINCSLRLVSILSALKINAKCYWQTTEHINLSLVTESIDAEVKFRLFRTNHNLGCC